MSIADLVAHIRRWLATGPKAFYRRHLDAAMAMSDDQIADIVRFACSRTGAQMALTHHILHQEEA